MIYLIKKTYKSVKASTFESQTKLHFVIFLLRGISLEYFDFLLKLLLLYVYVHDWH